MESTVDLHFCIRLIINTAAVLLLTRLYYHYSRHRENAASFILFGLGVFLVTALLHTADVSMGFAFGLFAVFSMLRYRTEALGIKEMTYLFLVISMALIAAVGSLRNWELVLLDGLIIVIARFLEARWLLPLNEEKEVEYERIDNIRPENHHLLMADLRERTGLDVIRAEVIAISFLRDTAQLRLHYRKDARS